MSSSHQSFFLFVFFFLNLLSVFPKANSCRDSCDPTKPGLSIRFPFRREDQKFRCGYPGFELSCSNRSQTILDLPNSGSFIVQEIDYVSQTIYINDPNSCLPSRLLKSFTVSGTPFESSNTFEFTFFNCSSQNGSVDSRWSRVVYCMSGSDFTVVAVPKYGYNESGPSTQSCSKIDTVMVPVLWPSWSPLETGVSLKWNLPACRSCEERGMSCGFKNDAAPEFSDIGCNNLHNSGLPRSAKYGLIIGVAIPGLLCFIGIACYLCGRARDYCHRRHHSGTEFTSTITPQSVVIMTGLDGPTIESYPKTLLGESRRLPKPNDNTCSICLCEYQPKEILRTIPECNHYFHVNCIDKWLRLNGTCPVCRNSPEDSAAVTPSTSTSSCSSSSSLLST